MEKSKIISALQERLDKLEIWKEENAEEVDKDKKKDSAKQKEDEEVCPNCGADLLFVEENIVYCPKCKDYFENGEEK